MKGTNMKASGDPKELVPRFKLSHFRSGDILLSTVQQSTTSAAIRAATGSRFSHAAIHWRGLTFLEAIGPGVCTFNILASAICDRANVRVLRLKAEYGSDLPSQAADAAYAFIGREYWVEGAIRAPLGIGSEDARGRLFCSCLVAEAFGQVGVNLCPGKNSRFVTPGDLSASSLLFDVTESVLYEAEECELSGIVRLIDGSDPATPQTEFRDALSRLMSKVRSAFQRNGLNTPHSLPHAMELLLREADHEKQQTLDDELSGILENAGYDELPTTVLFRQPFVGFDEATLSAIPLPNLDATISTHRRMLSEWIARNAERRNGLEQACLLYGDRMPFKVLAHQFRHEHAHWAAMEANIAALGSNVALMEQIRSRATAGSTDA